MLTSKVDHGHKAGARLHRDADKALAGREYHVVRPRSRQQALGGAADDDEDGRARLAEEGEARASAGAAQAVQQAVLPDNRRLEVALQRAAEEADA